MEEIGKSILKAIQLIFAFEPEVYGIIALTLIVTILSTGIAAFIGIPFGVFIDSRTFYGKKILVRVIHTLMGLPPVVAGLVVYLLISRKGPMGELDILFTPAAMVIAQVIIIVPIICGLSIAAVKLKSDTVRETCRGLGIGESKTLQLLIRECRFPIYSAVLTGYGRAISEVGAVMLVGGNIQYHTRVMTTSIVLETGKGNYDRALALGMILILISFVINYILHRFQEDK